MYVSDTQMFLSILEMHIIILCFFCVLLWVALCPFWFCSRLGWEENASCFTLFIFFVSRDCCVALPHDATGLFAFFDCGIS